MNARDGDFREWRRLQALHLRQQGWRRCDVAESLDVTERSVRRWTAIARVDGAQGLLSAPIPGRPPELSPRQRDLIPELLWHGAEAYGFRGSLWTCGRIAKVIEEEFGVSYDSGSRTTADTSRGCSSDCAGRRRRRPGVRRNGTNGRSSGGGVRRGRGCSRRPDTSAGPSFSWTRRGFTSCRRW